MTFDRIAPTLACSTSTPASTDTDIAGPMAVKLAGGAG